jgi:hypothetical protein
MWTKIEIDTVIERISQKHWAPIIRCYGVFVILAQSEADYNIKVNNIRRGDKKGFYYVKDVLEGRF